MSARRGLGAALLGVIVSLVAGAWLLSTIDLDAVGAQLGRIEPIWFLPAFGMLALQASLRAERWARILRDATEAPVRLRQVIGPMLIGYLVNAVVPGRLGEVARAVVAARRLAIGVGRAAASVIVERLVDLAALLVLVTVALLPTGDRIAMPLALLALALVAGLLLARRAEAFTRLLPRALPKPILRFVEEALESVARTSRPTLLAAGLLSAVTWLCDGTTVLLIARGMGIDLPFLAAVAIGLGAALGTALPAAPGYLATFEAGAVAFGALAGVPAEAILPIAVVFHVLGVGTLAIAGAVSLGTAAGGLQLGKLRSTSITELAQEQQ